MIPTIPTATQLILGVCTPNARLGDKIVLLKGCKMFAVLRENKFMGVASINGFMYGEGINMVTEWQKIEIF